VHPDDNAFGDTSGFVAIACQIERDVDARARAEVMGEDQTRADCERGGVL
jgi:hypothetical protein